MKTLNDIDRVLYYFNRLCEIPRGSENMKGISDYCVSFAKSHSLKYIQDEARNVIIYKSATKGYEEAPPIILQGHLDMVCQAEEGLNIDFLKQGISCFIEGDYLKANGTTLGADNGIAVAIILSILESDTILHPDIEAVFTTDEEIGMVGAKQLDFSLLKSKRMINLDSEEEDTITVSCAGGSDFLVEIPIVRAQIKKPTLNLTIRGLKGGHSGVEIDKGRINANTLMGRILSHIYAIEKFNIASLNGGDKANAIPNMCRASLVCENSENLKKNLDDYLTLIKTEISAREEDFYWEICEAPTQSTPFDNSTTENIIFILSTCINGVVEMSAEIKGLVETSLNLGVLKTDKENITLQYALRSNKLSALDGLEERLNRYFSVLPCTTKAFGHYPPWEFNPKSQLLPLYKGVYTEFYGNEPKIEALHAGLECGVFANGIENFDCIAVGPNIFDVHTTNEHLNIKSVANFYNLILQVLENSI